jgi:hypothetical protein
MRAYRVWGRLTLAGRVMSQQQEVIAVEVGPLQYNR